MAVTDFATDGIIAADLHGRTTDAKFQLGQTTKGTANTIWIYGKASGAVAIGTCTVNPTTFQITDAAGNYTADVAFTDAQHGWVRLTAGATS